MKRFIAKFKRQPPCALICVGGVVCVLVGVLVMIHFFIGIDIPVLKIMNHESAAYWGQIGDFIGGTLNPILSFLALVAVALSLYSQKRESATALRKSNQALNNQVAQTRIFQQQSFETVFFSLLNLQSSSLCGVRFELDDGTVIKGLEAVYEINKTFPEQELKDALIPGGRSNPARMGEIRNGFALKHNASLRHYLELVEQVILYVDEYPSSVINDKSRYFSILKAMLSKSELDIIRHYVGTAVGARLHDAVQRMKLFEAP